MPNVFCVLKLESKNKLRPLQNNKNTLIVVSSEMSSWRRSSVIMFLHISVCVWPIHQLKQFPFVFIRLEINVCRPDQLFLWVNFDGWRPSLWRNVVASSLTLMQFLYAIMLKHSIKRLFLKRSIFRI